MNIDRVRLYWLSVEAILEVIRYRSDPSWDADRNRQSFVNIPEVPPDATFIRFAIEANPHQIGAVFYHPSFDEVPVSEPMPQFPNQYSETWVLQRDQIERFTKSKINFREFL